MPYAIFDYMGGVLPMWTMVSPWSKQAHGCSCQGCKATNHTGTFRNLRNPATPTGRNLPPILPPEPTPTHAGTLRLRNLPRPSAPTHASIHRNPPKSSGAFRNWPPEPDLHQHTPELSGTFRNPSPEPTPAYAGTFRSLPELASRRNSPEPASGTYTSIRRNFQEPSGTPLRNLQQHTTEPSGTFRNLPPEPAPPTRTGTHRSLSGLKTPLAYAVGEKWLVNFLHSSHRLLDMFFQYLRFQDMTFLITILGQNHSPNGIFSHHEGHLRCRIPCFNFSASPLLMEWFRPLGFAVTCDKNVQTDGFYMVLHIFRVPSFSGWVKTMCFNCFNWLSKPPEN